MRTLWVVALLGATLLSGCTSTGDGYETPPLDDQGRYVIKMLPSNRFSPQNAVVPEGATVVWVNEGGSHNTYSGDGLWASTVSSDKGEHYAYTFGEEGTYRYHCQPHESLGMKGVVKVEHAGDADDA